MHSHAHLHTPRPSTRAHEPHTHFQARHQVSLQVAYWEEEKNKPNKPTNKKILPKQTKQNKKPHPTPQQSSKRNRKGAFTSEVKGRCVSSGDPRCSISLKFVKDSGRAGGRRRDRDV